MAKKKKTRVELRKNRTKPPRERDWTRGFAQHGYGDEATQTGERVRAKGDISRKRTIISDDDGVDETRPKIDPTIHIPGRVLRVHGLSSVVQTDDGRHYRCAVRRLLKSLVSDERNVVAAGDRVWIRPSLGDEGFIERV